MLHRPRVGNKQVLYTVFKSKWDNEPFLFGGKGEGGVEEEPKDHHQQIQTEYYTKPKDYWWKARDFTLIALNLIKGSMYGITTVGKPGMALA